MMLKTNKEMARLCIVLSMLTVVIAVLILSIFYTKQYEADVVFADVGDTYTVYANVEPWDANQEVTWTLEWDQEHTSSSNYNLIKGYPPTNNVGMEVDGLACKLTVKKYHDVMWVKQTVYLTLTVASVENPEMKATCLIKLG